MPGSKLESLGSLQRFNAALAGKAAETPQLDGSRAIFDEKVARVHDLAQEQAEFVASKQDVTRRFQEALADAQRMATAMRAALKAHYGPDSEKLVEFGILPFRRAGFSEDSCLRGEISALVASLRRMYVTPGACLPCRHKSCPEELLGGV